MLKENVRNLILVVSLLFNLKGAAQAIPYSRALNGLQDAVNKITSDISLRKTLKITEPALLQQFYQANEYKAEWFGSPGDSSRRQELLGMFQNRKAFMVENPPVHFDFIESVNQHKIFAVSLVDTLWAELRYTDAALTFFLWIAYGERQPYLKYNGLNYKPACFDIPGKLLFSIENSDYQNQVRSLEPTDVKYTILKRNYFFLDSVTGQPDFHEIKVHSKAADFTNQNLVDKLVQLGYLDAADTAKEQLLLAINKLQKQHNLPVQSKLNASCLKVLNDPLKYKIKELLWNVQWFRWLNCMNKKPYIMVNLPSNHLAYIEDASVKLESRMVVGKISTPSPTLTSEIKNVVYYPYWNIPFSIATKEILPELKKDPSYLAALKIEVLQRGKIIDGSAIDWNMYSRNNFPFELRQTPGCYNALGLLKFEFNNPFHVYLHDTNVKSAFRSDKRFFSHGCLRVEKPFELAAALGVGAGRINGDTCLTGRKPEIITLTNPVPIFVIYATVDVIEGELTWFEDAYKYMVRNQ